MRATDWDAKYTGEPHRWGRSANELLEELLTEQRAGRAVDLACGAGRHAHWMAARGWQVRAVDFSSTALEVARSEAPDSASGIDWVQADVRSWDCPDRVGVVLIAYLHLPEAELRTVLRRAAGWLVPGGRLIYLGHAWENLRHGVGGPTHAEVLPTASSLATAAQPLRIEQLRHVARRTDEGTAIDLLLVATGWQAASR
ncbi:MAG: class I SAM-dependent methyltransferase [Sciscionella sp.]